MAKIKSIEATEILDARGTPTIEVTVGLSDGATATASCPSGASVGSYEAAERRDGDPNRYGGKGVMKAIAAIHTAIVPKLLGREANNQQEIDRTMIELDGTWNKGMLGANAILPVSMAVCKAAAVSSSKPLFAYLRQFIRSENLPLKIPSPAFNLINGGKHGQGNLDFQEFLLIPATSKTFTQSLEMAVAVYESLREVLRNSNASTLIGDEGGFAPSLATNLDGLAILKQATQQLNLRFGFDVYFGLDVAANTLYADHAYKLKDRQASLSSEEFIAYFEELNKEFHLLYLEDPLAEDDWEGWMNLLTKLASQTLIVGDDLTTTNPYRLQMAIDKKAITSIVIKPNQIGTVIEALAVVEVARHSNLKIIVSHRSGETNDDFIADFAVGVGADYVKFGAPARGERIVKYNRLLAIERSLKTPA